MSTSSYILTSPVDVKSSASQGRINLYDGTGAFVVQLQSPAALASSLTLTLPSATATAGQFLQLTSPTTTAWGNPAGGQIAGITLRTMSGNIPTTPYGIASNVFTTVAYFIYGGTATNPTPTNIYIYGTTTATGTMTVRMLIYPAGTVLATVTMAANVTTPTLLSALISGTMPATQSILQVQFNRPAGAGTVSLYSFSMA